MVGYLIRRLLSSLVLLFLVLIAIFAMLQLIPGDPLSNFDPRIPEEHRQRLRALYGFDQPVTQQFITWMRAVVLDWDWGISLVYQRPVTSVIAGSLPATLLLAGGCVLFQYPLGLTLGILAARRQGGLLDHSIRIAALILYSIPVFWLGLMAILVLSDVWPIFPPSNMSSPNANLMSPADRFLDTAHHVVLPAAVMGIPLSIEVARFVRNSLIETLGQDYIRTARARGIGELRILWVHGLRNSLVPLIQIFGISLPMLLNGIFVVEFVFSWPGLGQTTLRALQAQDYPLVLATAAFTGVLVVLGNLMADLLHAVADPRVRRG